METIAKKGLLAVALASDLLIDDIDSESESDDAEDDWLACQVALRELPKRPITNCTRLRKMRDFVQITLKQYPDDDYKNCFGMERTTTEWLWQLYGCDLADDGNHPGKQGLQGIINLLLPIWAMRNQETFRGICDRFGVGCSNGYRMFRRFAFVISSKAAYWIKWPEGREFKLNQERFNKLHTNAIQNVVGCIGRSYIPVKGLKTEHDSYCTSKQFRAIILQGVCDSRMRFIDVSAGWPGATDNTHIWRNSSLYHKLRNDTENYLAGGTHLLGDVTFPIAPFLLVPYEYSDCLTPKEKHFNKTMCSSLVLIENAFGLLKGRFRHLRYLDMIRMKLASHVIVAACVLHNICIDQDDLQVEMDNDDGLRDIHIAEPDNDTDFDGKIKRSHIADELFINKMLKKQL